MAQSRFEPPGPGTWRLMDGHFPRPLTRYRQDLPHGWTSDRAQEGFGKYGFLRNLDLQLVNGFAYGAAQPVDGIPDSDSDPITLDDIPRPPETEFHRRVLHAKETLETKRWRTDLDRWDNEWKPLIRSNNRSLQAVEPAELHGGELIEHLHECRDTLLDHSGLVFRIVPAKLLPQGDFLAFIRERTELSAGEVIPLFRGASPDSLGPIDELQDLVTAIEARPEAREMVFSDRPPGDILEQLEAFGGQIEERAATWLSVSGYRTIPGFDLDNQYALERPATLVNTLRSGLEGNLDTDVNTGEPEELDAIRQRVPAEHRDTFADRYDEARLTHRIQDEREHLVLSTQGLLRRALLEAGQRLANRSQLRDPEHVVDMTHDEIIAALRGEPGPTASEVAAHVRYRQNHDASDAPDQLGAEQTQAIDPEKLPEHAARVHKARAARSWADEAAVAPESEETDTITGHAASPGTVEGTARVVDGSADFDRLQDGDILVAELTNSTFNYVLPMLDGIVTDKGGMLSHPAIVAREFGIPGVIGCEDATDRIQDGDTIIVDGEQGTVRKAD